MAKMNGLDKMTLADLKDLRTRVDQAISERQKSDRVQLRQKMEAMAAEAGLSIDEILSGAKKSRGPVAIKYRNPKDASQTWTGRGRPPRWMAEAMKKGAKKESFLI